jgi:hypothetical protein
MFSQFRRSKRTVTARAFPNEPKYRCKYRQQIVHQIDAAKSLSAKNQTNSTFLTLTLIPHKYRRLRVTKRLIISDLMTVIQWACPLSRSSGRLRFLTLQRIGLPESDPEPVFRCKTFVCRCKPLSTNDINAPTERNQDSV